MVMLVLDLYYKIWILAACMERKTLIFAGRKTISIFVKALSFCQPNLITSNFHPRSVLEYISGLYPPGLCLKMLSIFIKIVKALKQLLPKPLMSFMIHIFPFQDYQKSKSNPKYQNAFVYFYLKLNI